MYREVEVMNVINRRINEVENKILLVEKKALCKNETTNEKIKLMQ